jgi:hypothetical protein
MFRFIVCEKIKQKILQANWFVYAGMNSKFRQGFAIATRRCQWISKLFYNFEEDDNVRLGRNGTLSTYTWQNQQGQQQQPLRTTRNGRMMRGKQQNTVEESFI